MAAFEVGPLADAKKALEKAHSRLEAIKTPLTLKEVNEQVEDLAITFHRFGRAGRSPIAVAYPLEPEGPTGYDVASAAITALHGHAEAAALQMVHAGLKGDDSLVAGAARCVIRGFLIHLMPTSVIGSAITMLAEAVRGINAKTELKEITEAKDFLATQELAEWLRYAKTAEIVHGPSLLPDDPDLTSFDRPFETPLEAVREPDDPGDAFSLDF
ncbi:hypothetical protein [Streptomyces sp. TLI_185]|uniref:hypothetical protein n=1 Tax=Streptomyces sp. TLI_185 TaxID=2485151 RepID=UPI001615F01D|nr:hypothetical protein [Streptomyces sp. TLI_185]